MKRIVILILVALIFVSCPNTTIKLIQPTYSFSPIVQNPTPPPEYIAQSSVTVTLIDQNQSVGSVVMNYMLSATSDFSGSTQQIYTAPFSITGATPWIQFWVTKNGYIPSPATIAYIDQNFLQ